MTTQSDVCGAARATFCWCGGKGLCYDCEDFGVPFDITGMAHWWRRPLMRGETIYPWPMGHPDYEGKCVRLVDGVPMLMDRVSA